VGEEIPSMLQVAVKTVRHF